VAVGSQKPNAMDWDCRLGYLFDLLWLLLLCNRAVGYAYNWSTLCMGMMHLAGYRWDIGRRLPEQAVNSETKLDGIPPLLPRSRIGLNPKLQV